MTISITASVKFIIGAQTYAEGETYPDVADDIAHHAIRRGWATGNGAVGNKSVTMIRSWREGTTVYDAGSTYTINHPLADAMIAYGVARAWSPTWLGSTPLNEWVQIANTSGAGGAHINAFSGMALNRSTSEIVVAAAGGHADTLDNRVVSLDLSQDAPSWTTRRAATATTASDDNLDYYLEDGAPCSRHTYWSSQHIAQSSRVMLFGTLFTQPGAFTYKHLDGFDLDANAWDAAGTWDDVLTGGGGYCQDHDTGDVYSVEDFKVFKWTQSTASMALLKDFDAAGQKIFARSCCWDPVRNQLVSIGFGTARPGDSTSSTLNAFKVAADGQTRTELSFNSSAACTQFTTEVPWGHALEYDPDNDRFLIYAGGLGAAGSVGDPSDIYVVTPNSGATWDMSLLTLGAGSVAPAAATNSGVLNRFQYVPALKGFVYLNAATDADISFIRTA